MNNILEQIGITPDELIERIVDRALGMTADFKQTGEETWSEIPFSKVVDAKITAAIGSLVDKMNPIIEARIEEILRVEAEKIFLSPFQRVNKFGEAVGSPTTIKDIIADSAVNYWTTIVGEDGKPNPSYSARMERAEYYAKKVMIEHYEKELVSVVRDMAKKLKDKIPITISEEISKTVLKYIGK